LSDLATVLLGALGGIFVTAPLGPVNVMIIQRVFRYGFPSGVAAGCGATFADLIFASLAALGVSTVQSIVEGNSWTIQLVAGVVVVAFGARILWKQPGLDRLPVETIRPGLFETAAKTFFLTLTNPATVFGFLAYFGALGHWAPSEGDLSGVAALLAGVALGALGWWMSLAAVITRLRMKLTERWLATVNIVAGALLVGFGATILGRLSATYLEFI
jgi:threonine/homoserine/homoserine lactone efflux protein